MSQPIATAEHGADAIVLMGADEARTRTEQIQTCLEDARTMLLEVYEREGWKALGYATWRDYAATEFGQSHRRVYQLLEAATVERGLKNLSLVSEEESITESHLRPLSQLDPEQQREAWREANRLAEAEDARRTARHVENAVAKVQSVRQLKEEAREAMAELNRLAPPDFNPQADSERIQQTQRFYGALHIIATQPDPRDLIADIPDYQHYRFEELPKAVAWLNAFATVWEEVHG